MIDTALRHVVSYAIPTFLTKGLAFLLLPIYARALRPSDYGVIDFVGSIGPMIHIVLCLEVLQGMVRLRVDLTEAGRARLSGTTWTFSILMHTAFLAVSLPNAEWMAVHVLGTHELEQAAMAGAVSISMTSLVHMFMSQFRWELRTKAFSVLSTGYAATSIGLAALMALVLEYGVTGIMMGQIASAAAFSVIAVYLARSTVTWRLDPRLLGQMVRYSWPLVPASLSVMLTLYFNRIALTSMASLHEVGIFGMAARLASVTAIAMAALQMAITPLVFARYQEPETPTSLARLFRWALAGFMVLCLGLQIVARPAVEIIASETYSSSAQLIPILAPAVLLSQFYVFAPGMAIAKKTRQQLMVTLLAAALSLMANFALVPMWGALGAAVATLLSAVVFFVAWVMVSQRHYPVPFERLPIARGVLAFLAFSFVVAVVDNAIADSVQTWLFRGFVFATFLGAVVATGMISAAELRGAARGVLKAGRG